MNSSPAAAMAATIQTTISPDSARQSCRRGFRDPHV